MGGRTFGALDGGIYSFDQYVVHGTETSTLDESVARIEKGATRDTPSCKEADVRPYEDARFTGSGRSFECANGQSVVGYSLQGKGDISSYGGYFLFRISDAEGVAALQRAILSMEVSSPHVRILRASRHGDLGPSRSPRSELPHALRQTQRLGKSKRCVYIVAERGSPARFESVRKHRPSEGESTGAPAACIRGNLVHTRAASR